MLNGQPDAQTVQLVETIGRRAFAYAWQMLRNREDALDAVQSAMVATWRHRRRLRPDRDLRPWFFRVLRNYCIDVMRARRTDSRAPLAAEQPDTGSDNPATTVSRDEELMRLRAALADLPEPMREIILLRDFHDLAYAEIAQVLNIAPGTVMSRLHRARCALREKLLAHGKTS